MILTIKLYKELRNGSARALTPSEVAHIRKLGTSVQPSRSKAWQLMRDDDGAYSLYWRDHRDGCGCSWSLDPI